MDTLKAVRDALGGEVERNRYFTGLAKATTRSANALRGWLAGMDLSGFDANHAPECAHMDTMRDAGADPVGLLIARALEEGTEYANAEVVGLKFLHDRVTALAMEDGATEQRFTIRSLTRKLIDMGFYLACSNEDPWRERRENRDQVRRTSWYVNRPIGGQSALKMVRDAVDGHMLG
jgi:hypothetical protein